MKLGRENTPKVSLCSACRNQTISTQNRFLPIKIIFQIDLDGRLINSFLTLKYRKSSLTSLIREMQVRPRVWYSFKNVWLLYSRNFDNTLCGALRKLALMCVASENINLYHCYEGQWEYKLGQLLTVRMHVLLA